jgi:hypothetical protein
VAEEFDRIHSIERAKKVGSVDRIISPGDLRRYLVEAVGRGIGRTKQAWASCVSVCGTCRFCREGRSGQCLGGGGWILAT